MRALIATIISASLLWSSAPSSGVALKKKKHRSHRFIYLAAGAVAIGAGYFLLRKGGPLNRGTATLHINSEPTDADVYLDGDKQCSTPCTLKGIRAGEHRLKIVKELYGKWEKKLNLRGWREYEIEAILAPFGYEVVKCFGGYGWGPGRMYFPSDITKDKEGFIYVADWGNFRVEKFSQVGSFVYQKTLEMQPTGVLYHPGNNTLYVGGTPYLKNMTLSLSINWTVDLSLLAPGKMTVDPSGKILIADSVNNRIVKVDPEGRFLSSWEMASSREYPEDMEIGPDGRLYVVTCHYYNDRVEIYSRDGKKQGEFTYDINCATSIAKDRVGQFYVAGRDERWNGWIYKFLPDGKFIMKFQKSLTGQEDVGLPISLITYENGDLLILDDTGHKACFWKLSEKTINQASASIKALSPKTPFHHRGQRPDHLPLSPPTRNFREKRLRK